MIQKLYHDPISGIGGEHSYCYSSYWPSAFIGHIHSAAKETAPLLLEEKEKVLSDFISLHCKVEVAIFHMTGIPHRKVALTALLGYCLVSTNKIMVLCRKKCFYEKQKQNLHKYLLKTKTSSSTFLFYCTHVFKDPVFFTYSNYRIF